MPHLIFLFATFVCLVSKKISSAKRHSPPGNVIEEKIQPLYGGRPQSSTSGHFFTVSKGRGPLGTQGVPRVGLSKGHVSPPLVGTPAHFSPQSEQGPIVEGEKKIDINTKPLSGTKPPRVKRAKSAELFKSNGRSPSPPSSILHFNEETVSEASASKKAKVAWGSAERGRLKDLSRNESDETISNGQTDSDIHDLGRSYTQSSSPQNISSVSSFRDHDEETLSVLSISFPPSTTPTLGLSRSVLPPESQLERYSSLVENAIVASMVAPLSKEWKRKTHDFLPKDLRQDFKETLDELDKVKTI